MHFSQSVDFWSNTYRKKVIKLLLNTKCMPLLHPKKSMDFVNVCSSN